jgi:hypothetical protein
MTEPRNAPHLLRVEEPPERCAPLIAAAQALGLRIGWLDLSIDAIPLPASVETAAGLGILRAVAVGSGRSVAVKPLKGPAVLRDLLREHFRGCALVLIQGDAPADVASLRPAETGWSVAAPGEAARAFTTEALAAALRQPRPWGPPLPPRPPKPAPDPEKKKRKRRDQRVKKAKEKKAQKAG